MLPKDITFLIEQIPENTPAGASIYISGDFNGWFPDVEFFRAEEKTNGVYEITLRNISAEKFQYKFTRGSWDNSECGKNGAVLKNREFKWNGEQVIKVKIQGWEDIQNTRSQNVFLLTEKFFIPKLNIFRKIWLYLPPDYHVSTKKYPVLYMLDAQELFDAVYASNGEWAVDKTLNKFYTNGYPGAIVVGIESEPNTRSKELASDYSSGTASSDAEYFADFITNRLKPYIDKYYRTQPEAENTGIFGSTEAATFSLNLVLKHNSIFRKAGVFSPCNILNKNIIQFLSTTQIHPNTKIIFTAGLVSEKKTVQEIQELLHIFSINGLRGNNIKFEPKIDGKPEAWFWKREFPQAFLWLFIKR